MDGQNEAKDAVSRALAGGGRVERLYRAASPPPGSLSSAKWLGFQFITVVFPSYRVNFPQGVKWGKKGRWEVQ